MVDVAKVLMDGRKIKTLITGRRPGEKIHEVLISEEERYRTVQRGHHYVIEPILPELRHEKGENSVLEREYSSADGIMPIDQVRELLVRKDLMVSDGQRIRQHELLR